METEDGQGHWCAPWCLDGARGAGGAVTVGYVAAPGPLLSTPLLADTFADTVHARTVQYLLQAALKLKNKEEKKRELEDEVLDDNSCRSLRKSS